MRKYISVNYLPSSEKINYYGVIFCALLSVICIIATANNLLIIASLLTIIYAIYVSTKPANEILMFIALAIPNTRSMEAFGISGAILACTFFCIIRIIHTHKINRKILLVGLIYLIYSTQFIVRFNDLKIGIIMPLKMVAVLWTMMLVVSELKDKKIELGYVLNINNSMFIGIFSAVVASIVAGGNISRLGIVENDPNILSIECAFVLSVYFVMYFAGIISNIFFSCATVILVCLGIMCGSRMGMLLLLLVITMSIVLNIRKMSKILFLILICIIAIIAFLSSEVGQNVMSVLEMRSNVLATQNDISNGRFDLWKQYVEIFNSNKLLWIFGLGSYTYYGIESMAHNFLIEDVASYGIIGVVIIYYSYFIIFKSIATSNRSLIIKKRLFTVLPFWVPLVGGMTLHGISSLPNFLMMFVGIMLIYSIGQKNSFE